MQLAVCTIEVANTRRDGSQDLCQRLLVAHHRFRVAVVGADGGLAGSAVDQGEERVLLQTVAVLPARDLEVVQL